MFLDYPEQELIWRLTSTHPYEKNWREQIIGIKYNSIKDLEEFKKRILSHLKKEEVYEIGFDFIKVNTVLCGISTLKFIEVNKQWTKPTLGRTEN